METTAIVILVTGVLGVWWTFWQLRINAEIARAANDVQMRALIAIHKELTRMNDRFTPGMSPHPPAVPEPLRAALHALRPEAPR